LILNPDIKLNRNISTALSIVAQVKSFGIGRFKPLHASADTQNKIEAFDINGRFIGLLPYWNATHLLSASK
jgi:hypothetical protein